MMIWNRKEVYVGTSMKDFGEIRNTLAINQIDYEYRVVNRNSPGFLGSSRARTGTLGLNMDFAHEYYVYVHKNDFEKAYAILNIRSF